MTNKTIWKLPEGYVVLNPVTMVPMGKEEGEMGDDADTTLEVVPGNDEWKKVVRKDEIPFYFNIVTNESKWNI